MSGSDRYSRLMSNTLLFALSNFSSKVLNLCLTPFLTFALQETSVLGVTKLTQQCANLLIPVVGLGMSFSVIRFGLDKNQNKSQVFTNGLVTIFCGFVLMVLAYPLLRMIPLVSDYALLLYVYVLTSCLRTLCTQFIRSRQLNRLVALDGVLTTLTLLGFNILFLVVFKWGAAGYLLATICSDFGSTVFVFLSGKLWNYLDRRAFNRKLWEEMLRYSLPMIPAQISFWVINASDMFFVASMCQGYGGESGTHWTGLLSTGYYLPTIVSTLGGIFYEAWQLSAITEEEDRSAFFSQIFKVYQGVMFCCGAGIIWLCRPAMFIFRSNFYDAWQFVPFLTIASVFTCFNQFFNTIYMVYKRSGYSLFTMLAGAVVNCVLNFVLILAMGPVGAALASAISMGVVFLLRVISTQGLIRVDYGPAALGLDLVLLTGEAVVLLLDLPGAFWITGAITLVVILLNLKDLWHMGQLILGRFLKRGRKA